MNCTEVCTLLIILSINIQILLEQRTLSTKIAIQKKCITLQIQSYFEIKHFPLEISLTYMYKLPCDSLE